MPQKVILSDEPTAEDGLKRERFADAFAQLAETCHTPLVIGLYGTWGIGKTSLMQLIRSKLKADITRSVWFNPWMHQFDENPVLGLAHALSDSLGLQDKAVAKKLLTLIAAAFGSRILKFTTGLKLLELLKIGKIYEEERFQVREAQLRLRDHFEELIKRAKVDGEDEKRLIVFIDDLDRCMPDETLKLLEALKLYLNIEDCVYFLGVDRSALEQSIRRRYQEIEIKGIDYLDKIVQLPFVIPPIESDAMDQFVKPLLSKGLESCQPLLVKGLGDNPRQIKRFINTLTLNHQLASAQEIRNYNPSILAYLLLIQYRDPALYRVVAGQPDILCQIKEQTEKADSLREKHLAHDKRLKELLDEVEIPRDPEDLQGYIYLTKIARITEEPISEFTEPLKLNVDLHLDADRRFGEYLLTGIGYPIALNGQIEIDGDILHDLARRSQDISVIADWEKALRTIGKDLNKTIFSKNHNLLRDYTRSLENVGGIENTSVRFSVTKSTNNIIFESLYDDEYRYLMLHAPIFRSLPSPFHQFSLDGPLNQAGINCLIIEADTSGLVPPEQSAEDKGGPVMLEKLNYIKEESRWLFNYLTKNRNQLGINDIYLVADTSKNSSFANNLEEKLKSDTWDIVHYAGHSYFDKNSGKSYLFLPSELGPQAVHIDEFASWTRHARTRFLYLSTSGSSPPDFLFELASRGLPAILGFLWDVEDYLAFEYMTVFYESLFEKHRAIKLALLDTRQQLYNRYSKKNIWAASTLFSQ